MQNDQDYETIMAMLRYNFVNWWVTEEHVNGRVELERPCNLAGGLGANDNNTMQIGAFTAAFSFVSGKVGRIGRYCSIAEGVGLGHVEHPTDWFTTLSIAYDPEVFKSYADSRGGSRMPRHSLPEGRMRKPIELGNDVWIGHNAYVRSGTFLGDGCIVGSHSVVTKDVPPYAIAVGNPARIVKYRFSEDIIARLLKLQWWRYDFTEFDGVDGSDIERFCDGVERLIEDGLQPYCPEKIIVTGDGRKGGLRCRLHRDRTPDMVTAP